MKKTLGLIAVATAFATGGFAVNAEEKPAMDHERRHHERRHDGHDVDDVGNEADDGRMHQNDGQHEQDDGKRKHEVGKIRRLNATMFLPATRSAGALC